MFCSSVDVLVLVYLLPSRRHLRCQLQGMRLGFMCTDFVVVVPFVPRLHTDDDIQTLKCRNEKCLTFWRRNYFFLILAQPVYKM